MARVSILRSWGDDDALQVVTETTAEHPDALDMAAARALALYREALGMTLDSETDSE